MHPAVLVRCYHEGQNKRRIIVVREGNYSLCCKTGYVIVVRCYHEGQNKRGIMMQIQTHICSCGLTKTQQLRFWSLSRQYDGRSKTLSTKVSDGFRDDNPPPNPPDNVKFTNFAPHAAKFLT